MKLESINKVLRRLYNLNILSIGQYNAAVYAIAYKSNSIDVADMELTTISSIRGLDLGVEEVFVR